MSRFIESIRILNGRRSHLAYHNARADSARKKLNKNLPFLDFTKIIKVPATCRKGLYKCRIVYDHKVREITYTPYQIKSITTLQAVIDNDINYYHKYEDRAALDALYHKKNGKDDILIIKNGKVTDTYYCNIAFLQNSKWYTPATPLLAGTMRAYLLDKKKIEEQDILLSDIKDYQSICLFNAMIPFGKIVLSTEKIYLP